jgi:ABC-type nitrate/sulfonate/bicarbonate transport system substrate-binding protein
MRLMSFSPARRLLVAAATTSLLAATCATSLAADKVRVAKAITSSFPFAGLELGKEQGIWASEGLEIEIAAFRGDGQMQQGFAAGAIDFGVGSGPGMGYASKGVPAHAVAALASEPRNMALVVTNNSGIKSVDDLKGKRVGVTTAGALTDWLTRRLAQSKGWGPDGLEVIPMGEMRTRLAAMRAGELQASVNSIEEGLALQERGEGHVLATFGEAVPDFHTHVIFATDAMIQKNPDIVRRFLRAWFKVAKFMRENRAATVASVSKTMQVSEKVTDMAYDDEIRILSPDGAFSPKAVEVIRASLKDLGILDTLPDAKALFNPDFVPVK